jgi:hypothetical protein
VECTLVLVLEIAVAAIAAALILLSLKTLQSIKHLGIGKSFWTPVAVSGFLFFFGSVVAILFELNFTLMPYTDEVVQISRLLALGILVAGVFSYSRRVTRNLGETFRVPVRAVKADAEPDEEAEEPVSPEPAYQHAYQEPVQEEAVTEEPVQQERAYPDVPAGRVEPPAESIHERVIEEGLETEAVQECKYKFGYLRTLSKDASIPDECYSCDRIIQCRHSRAKTVESPPAEQSESVQ